ncbi:MAG: murein peptide amidase A [Cyanobacteria bacterium SIG28]|nr:murein peptide amidase A [Cyanobacteria bacterium SIG28]
MVETSKGNYIFCLKNAEYNGVLIIGVFHGDEPQGKHLIEKYLKGNKTSKLAFIPELNPDGRKLGTRTNGNGVDLNRNFPTKNWILSEKNEFFGGEVPASEIETNFLINIVEELNPKLIVTLHAPFKVVNYDGNARAIAEMISEIIKYPVVESVGYATPGSFGSWAGIEKGIPTITLELDEEIPVEDLEKPVFEIFKRLEDFDKIDFSILDINRD